MKLGLPGDNEFNHLDCKLTALVDSYYEDDGVKCVNNLVEETDDCNLYHYTSYEGAKNIIESGSLYATESRYFDDKNEIKYLGELLKRRLFQCTVRMTEESKSQIDYVIQMLLLKSYDVELEKFEKCYISCFTKQKNQLSQWYGHCPRNKGVNLGFNAYSLIEYAKEQGFQLCACRYFDHNNYKEIDLIIEALVELTENYKFTGGRIGLLHGPLGNMVCNSLLKIAASIKDPFYSEEKEYRVVSKFYGYDEFEGVKHRVGEHSLIPYIDFKLKYSQATKIDISSLMIGPTIDPKSACNSFDSLLKSMHIDLSLNVDYSLNKG